jgi:poly(beta-D-mannuronate) lyase
MKRWLPKLLLAVLLPACSACAPLPKTGTAALLAPPGYYQPVAAKKGGSYECPDYPEPHTGPLVFASKYEGDGSSKSKINEEAESRYKESVKSIRALESLSSSITRDFIRGAGEEARDCLIGLLSAWAEAGALLHGQANPIGQAMRKWALATTGVHYLQIMQLDADLPAADARKRRHIEQWFARLAAGAIAYYSNRGADKANNHDYWAAWAVMVTAVNLQDRQLYAWAIDKYRQGIRQIDGEGYLPNEMKRKSRALSYQNFALQPLVMLAVFAEANGQLLPTERAALERLAEKVVAGISDPRLFQAVTGAQQETAGLVSGWSLAWIPPWRAHFDPDVVEPLRAKVDAFRSTRLGGDMDWLFGADARSFPSGAG